MRWFSLRHGLRDFFRGIRALARGKKNSKPHKKFSSMPRSRARRTNPKKRKLTKQNSVVSSASQIAQMENDDLLYANTKLSPYSYIPSSKRNPVYVSKEFITGGVAGAADVYSYSSFLPINNDVAYNLAYTKMSWREARMGNLYSSSTSVKPVPLFTGASNSLWYNADGGFAGPEYDMLALALGKSMKINISTKFEIVSGSVSDQELDVFFVRMRKDSELQTEQILGGIDTNNANNLPVRNTNIRSVDVFVANQEPQAFPVRGSRSLLYDFRDNIDLKNHCSIKFVKRFKLKAGGSIKWNVRFPTGRLVFSQQVANDPRYLDHDLGGFFLFRCKGTLQPVVNQPSVSAPATVSLQTVGYTPTCFAFSALSKRTISTKVVPLQTGSKKIINFTTTKDYGLTDAISGTQALVEINTETDLPHIDLHADTTSFTYGPVPDHSRIFTNVSLI